MKRSKHKTNLIGKLFLIPSGLGNGPLLEVLPLKVKKKVEELDYYIAENEKTARRFIKKLVPTKSQPSLKFDILNKFTPDADLPSFLEPCHQGHDIGVLSEAGCPGIADPGAEIVKIAHEKKIRVIPLVGPSSITLALMASGLNGQNFAFHGYLPIDKKARKKEMKKLEHRSFDQDQAQIFIETPYRNQNLLDALKKNLAPETQLCIAREITQPQEYIATKPIGEWQDKSPDLHKKPCIFILQKKGG